MSVAGPGLAGMALARFPARLLYLVSAATGLLSATFVASIRTEEPRRTGEGTRAVPPIGQSRVVVRHESGRVAHLGHLSLVQLMVVAAVVSVAAVFFDTAHTAILPTLVGRRRVSEASERLQTR